MPYIPLRAEEAVLRGRGGRGNVARKAALYFAQRYTGIRNREIGEYLGGIQPSAVSKASARLKAKMRLNMKLPKLIEEIDSSFKASYREKVHLFFMNLFL